LLSASRAGVFRRRYRGSAGACGEESLFEREDGLFIVSCENDDNCQFTVQTIGGSAKEAVRKWNTRITDVAQSVGMREEEILAMALIINPFADELDDRDGGKLFDAARRLWTAGYRKSDGGLAVGVPAPMQGSSDGGLAQDAERPEDTTQGDRPARPVAYPSDSHCSAGNGGEIEVALSECRDFLADLVGGARFDVKADHHAKELIEQADAALTSTAPQEAQVTVCTNCGGGGWLETVRCKRCKGRGFR
jgi:hypothetical protein